MLVVRPTDDTHRVTTLELFFDLVIRLRTDPGDPADGRRPDGAGSGPRERLFVVALATPESYDDEPGGLYGPFVLAACYATVRIAHLVVYLVALSALRRRNVGGWNVQRLVAAGALLLLLPVGAQLPAVAALGVLLLVLAGLIGYEAVGLAEERDRIRHAAH